MSSVIFNNFTRGKLDEDLSGRFDLPVFTNGFPFVQNFISNYKGVLKFRPGFEYISETKNNEQSKLIQFKFNTDQAYLLEVTKNGIRFYTYDEQGNFGYVSNDSDQILEIGLPTGIDSDSFFKTISVTQNADAMIMTSKNNKPLILKRRGSKSFTLETLENLKDNDGGYPTSAAFYKGRLWFGGFANAVTSIKASKVGDYFNFTIPTENIKDSDALALTLTDISDPILWVYGGKNNLLVGNGEGISIVNGGSPGVSITSTKINADLGNKEGSCTALPTEKDSQMIYIGVDQKRVYAFDYDLVSEKFISSNLNLLAEEVPQIKEIYYKRDGNNLIYGRTSDGQMIALLYNKAENICGWFPLKTKGFVNSMCVVSRPDGKDDLFISVTRDNINYVERLSDEIDFDNELDVNSLDEINSEKDEKSKKIKMEDATYLDSWEKITSKTISNAQFYFTDGTYKVLDWSKIKGSSSGSGWEALILYDGRVIRDNDIVPSDIIKTVRIFGSYGLPTDRPVYFLDLSDGNIKKHHPINGKWYRIIHEEGVTTVSGMGSMYGYEDIGSLDITSESYGDTYYELISKIEGYNGLEGKTFSVFASGGYLGDYVVDENGVINLDKEVFSAIVGYKYLGIAKTFNIGSWIDGVNFQTVKKRVVSFALRFVNSGSFKIGTSLDNLEQVQTFTTNDSYDSPPSVMNGDKFIYGYNDDHTKEKCLYFVQDEPVPCNLTMVECKVTFNKLD